MKILIVTITTLLLAGCGHGVASGNGKKIGQIIQLGKHGMWCDTYEGKMVRGGFNTGSGVAGGVFDFTVEGEDLFKQLNAVMEKQQKIEVEYDKVSLSGPCTCESDHFIRRFKVLSETTPSVTINPQISEKERKRQELLKQLTDLDK